MPDERKTPTRTRPVDQPPKKDPDHSAPVRVLLLGDDEIPTASLVETRLRNVRQLYALAFMLRVPEINGTDVIPIAALLLSTDQESDLDPLVPLPLQIQAAGRGSFWVDLFLQLPSHLPSTVDLKQWAEWLKNAYSALSQIAAICAVLGTWLKKHSAKKVPVEANAGDPVAQLLKRVDELKDATEEEKEQIRNAILRDLRAFNSAALDHKVDIPKHFPLKLAKKKTSKKRH